MPLNPDIPFPGLEPQFPCDQCDEEFPCPDCPACEGTGILTAGEIAQRVAVSRLEREENDI